MICIRSQASSDYDPSFVTEVLLKEIQYSDTPNEDISLLKNVAVQAYLGSSAHFTSFPPLWLTELYLSGIRYHYFSNRNFFFGDGLLSRGAEGGSSGT